MDIISFPKESYTFSSKEPYSYPQGNLTLVHEGTLLSSPKEPYSLLRMNLTPVPEGTLLLSLKEHLSLIPEGTSNSYPRRNHAPISRGTSTFVPKGTSISYTWRNLLFLHLYICYETYQITFFPWTIHIYVSSRYHLIFLY